MVILISPRADDIITNPSDEEIHHHHHHHHPTVALGKFVYLASGNDFLLHTCSPVSISLPANYILLFFLTRPAQNRLDCMGKCSLVFMSCCYGGNSDCRQKARAGDRTVLNKCDDTKATCIMACPAAEDEATDEVTTDFDNDNEGARLRGHLIKPVIMADASGPAQDYQCIRNCDTGLDICCKIANTANNCVLKYYQGNHTWYNICNSALYSCRSACPRADDKAPTVTTDIRNEGTGLRDNPIKPIVEDTFIMNPSSFVAALNKEIHHQTVAIGKSV